MDKVEIIITKEDGSKEVINGFGSHKSVTVDTSLVGSTKTTIRHFVLEDSCLYSMDIKKVETNKG